MAVEEIKSVIGDDGIQVAVEALKEMAGLTGVHDGVRLEAAQTLLRYGLATYDALGNPQLA